MTRQVLMRLPPVNRRQTVMQSETIGPKKKHNIAEVAGATAADCAAVCCCCPFAVMNLLVLALYKVPVGLCKKAIRKSKLRRMLKKKRALLQQRPGSATAASRANVGLITLEDHLLAMMKKDDGAVTEAEKVGDGGLSEASELEKEMWARFSGTGFWRSSSRREVEP